MANLIFIGFTNLEQLNKGKAFWRNEYRNNIAEYTDLASISTANTPRGIAYLCGKANLEKPCFELDIEKITDSRGYFTVEYSISAELKYPSFTVIDTLRNIVLNNEPGKYVPFCVALPENRFTDVIEDEAIVKHLRKLGSKNNWLEIYNYCSPVDELHTKPQYWNNVKILEAVSFATAKLSETYINVFKTIPDDVQRKKFLEGQKVYRRQTLEIRKRIIELKSDSAGAYSNLAYSHYQFCRELMMPGGRRDGKAVDEAKLAIEYMEKALSIDPARITDLYRKGQLHVNVMPKMVLFAGAGVNSDKIEESKFHINEGIKCFRRVEEIFELIPLVDDKSRIRYFKEYIKSLYNMSLGYEMLCINNISYSDYIYSDNTAEKPNEDYLKTDLQNIEKALEVIIKCIKKDDNAPKPKDYQNTKTRACNDGEIDAVLKEYTCGKMYFRKCYLLKKLGKENESMEFGVKCEKLFKAAIHTPYPKEKVRQNKFYISEKLARYYIMIEKYEDAVKTLSEVVKNKFTDYYIRYAYAVAAIKLGHTKEAKQQVEIALQQKRNPEIWFGELLKSYIAIESGDSNTAWNCAKFAAQKATLQDKKNVDTDIIDRAFVYYKSGKVFEGCEALKLATSLNPSRKKAIARTLRWLSEVSFKPQH